MTVTVRISEAAKAYAERLVGLGSYESFDQAVEAGLWRLHDDGDHKPTPPEHLAAIDEGLADIEAGRVRDADEVFDELIAKYQALAERR